MLGWIVFFLIILLLLFIYKTKAITIEVAKFTILLIFIAFAGFRTNMGSDHFSYIIIYETISQKGFFSYDLELGWQLINNIAILFGSFQYVYLISSVIIYSLIFKRIFEDNKYWVSGLVVFIITPSMFLYTLITVKQYIAIAFFLFSIIYIQKGKPFIYFLINIISFLVHKSAIILFFVYPIVRRKISNIIFLALIVSAFLLNYLVEIVITTVPMFGKYIALMDVGFDDKGNTLLFRLIIEIITALSLLSLKSELNYEDNHKIQIDYNIFMFGLIITIGLFQFVALKRIGFYFLICGVTIVPRILVLKLKSKNIIGLLSIFFMRFIYPAYLFVSFYQAGLKEAWSLSLVTPFTMFYQSILFLGK